jgi:hypothetical protein
MALLAFLTAVVAAAGFFFATLDFEGVAACEQKEIPSTGSITRKILMDLEKFI